MYIYIYIYIRTQASQVGVLTLVEASTVRPETERETTGYEPFAIHTLIQWAIERHLIKRRVRDQEEGVNVLVAQTGRHNASAVTSF